MMNHAPKDHDSRKLSAEVEAFLARGGRIKQQSVIAADGSGKHWREQANETWAKRIAAQAEGESHA